MGLKTPPDAPQDDLFRQRLDNLIALNKVIKRSILKKVVVDTTVQEKYIAFPTDSKLLDRARVKRVKLSQRHGLPLWQNDNRVCPRRVLQTGHYVHARQYKRMRNSLRKLTYRVGRVTRDIERQLAMQPEEVRQAFAEALAQARQILHQTQHPKSKIKLYSLHAPEVDCISKGKAHKHYEFGVKPERAYGVKDTKVYISGQRRGVTAQIKRELKRRSAVESEIGHMKQDGLLGRSYLKGEQGDAINAPLAACGHNLRKILTPCGLCCAGFFGTV